MPVYNSQYSLQSVLNAALGKYRSWGFRLVERGDHELRLHHNDDLVAVFSSTGVGKQCIQEACEEYLREG